MKIEITGLKELKADLDNIGRKTLALATAAAIKDTAFQVQDAVKKEMSSAFDRPTSWSIKIVRVDISEANKKSQTAYIGLTFEPGNANLWESPAFAPHQIHGGARGIKPSERQLRAAGILPEGYSIAPARDAWLDQYGNIPGPEMVQILSSIKAFGWLGGGYMMNRTERSRGKRKDRYFVMYRAGRPIGIWERLGPGNVKPVIMFIRRPSYKPRFKFYDAAMAAIEKHFDANFWSRWKEYLNYKI
jgi:hypothetical protein